MQTHIGLSGLGHLKLQGEYTLILYPKHLFLTAARLFVILSIEPSLIWKLVEKIHSADSERVNGVRRSFKIGIPYPYLTFYVISTV